MEDNQPSRDPRLQSRDPTLKMELGPEPLNIENELQNEEPSNEEMPNPFDYLELSWKDNISENSDDNCDSVGYMSPPPNLSSDEMTSVEDDSNSDVSTEDNSSDDDSREERK